MDGSLQRPMKPGSGPTAAAVGCDNANAEDARRAIRAKVRMTGPATRPPHPNSPRAWSAAYSAAFWVGPVPLGAAKAPEYGALHTLRDGDRPRHGVSAGTGAVLRAGKSARRARDRGAFALAVLLWTCAACRAAMEAFMSLPGIAGEATETNHRGWVRISAFSEQQVRSLLATNWQFSDLVLPKGLDQATPQLMACGRSDHFATARLQLLTVGDSSADARASAPFNHLTFLTHLTNLPPSASTPRPDGGVSEHQHRCALRRKCAGWVRCPSRVTSARSCRGRRI